MTEAARAPLARGWRVAQAALIAIFFGVVVDLAFRCEGYERLYAELEMKALPAPTELLIEFGGFVRSPAGLAVWVLAGLALMGAAGSGLLPKEATIVLLLVTPLALGLFHFALRLPLQKIQTSLSR